MPRDPSHLVTRALRRARRYLPLTSRRRCDALARQLHEQALETNHVRHVFETWVPPGHFYSPHPDVAEVEARAATLWDDERELVGVDLRETEQLELLDTLAELAVDMPFPADQGSEYRYWFDNPAYSWADGTVLHTMLRHIRPSRIVEVGSGYSSAMTLDTIEHWLAGDVEVSFVEPYSELLRSLVRPGDEGRVTIHEVPVQDVDLDVFTSLAAGDVLFIDSTHVVKAGADVNHLFFEVLPRLAAGVWIHVHDVFAGFEYPLAWVREGRAWQELYLLRAFLMYNRQFEVRWFQDHMWRHHRTLLEDRLPLIGKGPGGNIWLQKVAT